MTISFTEISPAIGAEAVGVTSSQLAAKTAAEECLEALEDRGVLVIREVHIGDDDLVAFSRLLGEVMILPRGGEAEHPEIMKITRDPSKSPLAAYQEGTFHWHIDGSTDPVPNKATLLTALQITDDGSGDTEFASTYAAYDSLPEDRKAELDGLRVVHSFAQSQRLVHPEPTEAQEAAWTKAPSREHPLVWKRRNGRRSMLLGATAEAVVGRSPKESRELLDGLLDWATRPQFVLRHKWRPGDLVIWDNTGMLHRARPYSETSSRFMHRTTILGEEPVT